MSDRIDGPHLNAAFLCEKVLREGDNVPTFVRVVERFLIPKFPEGMPVPPGFPAPIIQFNLVVIVKAGGLGGGKHTLTLRLNKPDFTALPDNNVEVFINGSDDNGAMVVAPLSIPNPEEGLHWFDISFDGSLLTRVPLRVLYQPLQQMQIPMMT